MNLLLREATPADAALMATLTCACWEGKDAPGSSGHRETPEQVAQDLNQGGGFILLQGEMPVGVVRWLPIDSEPGIWEILRMGVLPEHRGQHHSFLLLEAVIHQAQLCEIGELRLAVRQNQERLLDLYATYGFEAALELEYTHANPSEQAPIVMRRLLRS